MVVRELKGHKGWRAFNVFNNLLLGLTMLPMYSKEDPVEFLARTGKLPDEDKIKLIRLACMFVPLTAEEILAMLGHCEDPNGVPYSEANIRNLSHDQIMAGIVAVCKKIIEMPVDIISDEEKKNCPGSP